MFVDMESRVHGLCIVVVLLFFIRLLLLILPLLLCHVAVIGKVCVILLVSLLKRLDLGSEVNFALKKLLGHDLLLARLFPSTVDVLMKLTFVGSVYILRACVELSLLL
jgi:hypothetical protein